MSFLFGVATGHCKYIFVIEQDDANMMDILATLSNG